MKLKELASQLAVSRISGDDSIEITGIEIDSRKVKPGDLFVCVSGKTGIADRHLYAAQAVQNGASAIVVERDVDIEAPKLFVTDTWDALAVLSCHFYGYPSREMKLIGVTGTNGKTTTTILIDHIFTHLGKTTGLIGTGHTKVGTETFETVGTTQDAHELQKNLAKMRDIRSDYCIMEVSSHGLDLGRVKGCSFRTAIFTNLTQDHLDYHGTMEAYREAKGLFFARLGNEYSGDPDAHRYAVLNADEAASAYFAKLTSAQVVAYGIDQQADVRAEQIRFSSKGTSFRCVTFRGTVDLELKLVGKFNVYNALAAIAAALLEGVSLEQIKSSLETVKSVEGRMEVVDAGQPFLVLVDYAHTPDGLENALSTIRHFAEGKVYCVFGCGGDRDRTKRPLMGKVSAAYSDYVYVTSDNPRTENPGRIIEDIVPGLHEAGLSPNRYETVVDRREAISRAVAKAGPQDIVLIAGKGHETYQDIMGIKHDFDDREVARAAIRGRYHD